MTWISRVASQIFTDLREKKNGVMDEETLNALETIYKPSLLLAALEIVDSSGAITKYIGARSGQFCYRVAAPKDQIPSVCFGNYCPCTSHQARAVLHGETCQHLLAIRIADATKATVPTVVDDDVLRDMYLTEQATVTTDK